MKRILIPIDFSTDSLRAFFHAVHMAIQMDIGIDVITVKHPSKATTDIKADNILQAPESVDLKYEWIFHENVADAVLEKIEKNEYLMVVIGTHGRTGISKLFNGSVAEKLISQSPIPVLTIPKHCPDHAFRNILVAIDFSEISKSVLEYAIFLKHQLYAKITVIHSKPQIIKPELLMEGINAAQIANADAEQIQKLEYEQFLSPYLIDIDNFIVEDAKPIETITNTASNGEFDLILMGSRGLGALQKIVLGSTATGIIQQSSIPVLTVNRNFVSEKIV